VRGGVRRVALVGDHRQLPPTIICRSSELEGFSVSLFDRLVSRGVQPHMLNVQYRMHPAIAHYPSEAFYQGELGTGVRGAMRSPPLGFEWPSPKAPIAFVQVMGSEQRVGSSYSNQAEAGVLAEIVRGLLTAGGLNESDIGIIAPYNAQVRLIRQRLGGSRAGARMPASSLEVSSVDGFQGREKEVIIISATRANTSGDIGFVRDVRRMNVSLTRARRGLIVLGESNTLMHDEACWCPWLQWALNCGVVVGQPPAAPDEAADLARLAELSVEELLAAQPGHMKRGVPAAEAEQEFLRPMKARRFG